MYQLYHEIRCLTRVIFNIQSPFNMLRYSILSASESGFLRINASSGVITLSKSLENSVSTILQGLIQVKDLGKNPNPLWPILSDSYLLRIEINRNLHIPKFQMKDDTFQVNEAFAVGGVLMTFIAKDLDRKVHFHEFPIISDHLQHFLDFRILTMLFTIKLAALHTRVTFCWMRPPEPST